MTDPFRASSSHGNQETGKPLPRATAMISAVFVACFALALVLTNVYGGVLFASPQSSGSDLSAEGLVTVEPVEETGNTTEVNISVDHMSFMPSQIEVPIGNRLIIHFENTGDQRHDLVTSNGAATSAVPPGASETLDAGIVTGTTEAWCSLPGHRQMGMTLRIIAVTPDGEEVAQDVQHGDHKLADEAAEVPSMDQLIVQAGKKPAYPAELDAVGSASLHKYTFSVTEDEQALAEGVVRPIWTYNGTSPGPMLHGRVGDQFVITLVNDGTMGHSVDFHAGDIAPNEPMRTIEPGESLEYRFDAKRAGIWMYHCGTMPMTLHIANGMFGAVIIEPDELPAVDKTFALVGSEVYLSDPLSGNLVPELAAFNGFPFGYAAHPLEAKVGERIRMWVLNVGPNWPLSFHVVGTQFDTVWNEGTYSLFHGNATDGITVGEVGAQVLPLLPAQGGFVEFVPVEAGEYTFVNHAMAFAEKGAYGKIVVTD